VLETDVVAAFETLALQAGMPEVVRPSWTLSKTRLRNEYDIDKEEDRHERLFGVYYPDRHLNTQLESVVEVQSSASCGRLGDRRDLHLQPKLISTRTIVILTEPFVQLAAAIPVIVTLESVARMSFDDLGSSAWADTSPSASPKLDNDDIWGNTRGTRIPDLSPGGFGVELGEEASEPSSGTQRSEAVDHIFEPAATPTGVKSPELNTSQKQANIDSLQNEDNGFEEQLSPEESGQTSATLVIHQTDDDFDDDTDFEFGAAPAAQTATADEFDDFGDFGDFDDAAQEETSGSAEQGQAGQDSFGNQPFMDEPEGLDEEIWEDSDRPTPAVSSCSLTTRVS
jgi:hypothetical protein